MAEPKKEPPKKKERKKKKDTDAKQIEIIRRQTWATDLRVQGLSYRRIARRLKELKLVNATYSEALAYKDVADAMTRLISEQKELSLQNLYLDLRRYDELFEKSWALAMPKSEEGGIDLPPDPVYFGVVTHILGVRERLLDYKSLWADKGKPPPINLTYNFSSFSTAEILEMQQRIQSGEEPFNVITEIEQRRSGSAQTPA